MIVKIAVRGKIAVNAVNAVNANLAVQKYAANWRKRIAIWPVQVTRNY